jgi:hypothetical protein
MLRACDPAAVSDIQDEALPLESSATVRGPARSLSSLRLGNAEQRRHIRAGAVGLVAVSVAGVVLVATVVRAQAASTSRHPSGSAIAANSLRCPAEMPGALPAYPRAAQSPEPLAATAVAACRYMGGGDFPGLPVPSGGLIGAVVLTDPVAVAALRATLNASPRYSLPPLPSDAVTSTCSPSPPYVFAIFDDGRGHMVVVAENGSQCGVIVNGSPTRWADPTGSTRHAFEKLLPPLAPSIADTLARDFGAPSQEPSPPRLTISPISPHPPKRALPTSAADGLVQVGPDT